MSSRIVCFGEVLWDIFPNYKKIGGAPLNVAMRLASFSNDVAMISAVGLDDNGTEILRYIDDNGIKTEGIEVHSTYKTGEVGVTLDAHGSASYEIKFPAAWDHISLSDFRMQLAENSEAFIYGSLASRNEATRKTLFELLNKASYRIFDINLREPHYSKELLSSLMQYADFIKFNDDELFEISEMFGSKYNSIEQNIRYMANLFETRQICVTKGRHGAVLFLDGEYYYNSGYLVKVKDTVGAGDSFLGTLIHFLLNNKNPQKAVDYACAMGALVARTEGANPKISEQELNEFVNPE